MVVSRFEFAQYIPGTARLSRETVHRSVASPPLSLLVLFTFVLAYGPAPNERSCTQEMPRGMW